MAKAAALHGLAADAVQQDVVVQLAAMPDARWPCILASAARWLVLLGRAAVAEARRPPSVSATGTEAGLIVAAPAMRRWISCWVVGVLHTSGSTQVRTLSELSPHALAAAAAATTEVLAAAEAAMTVEKGSYAADAWTRRPA